MAVAKLHMRYLGIASQQACHPRGGHHQHGIVGVAGQSCHTGVGLGSAVAGVGKVEMRCGVVGYIKEPNAVVGAYQHVAVDTCGHTVDLAAALPGHGQRYAARRGVVAVDLVV